MTTGKARYLGASSMRAWQFATIAKAISHPDQYYSR
jgi:aryl-alcohol dehydrogenase-like predicted oxidoreductase